MAYQNEVANNEFLELGTFHIGKSKKIKIKMKLIMRIFLFLVYQNDICMIE